MAFYTLGHIVWWLLAAVLLGFSLGWIFGGRGKTKRGGILPVVLGAALVGAVGLGGFFGQKATARDLTAKVTSKITSAGVPLAAPSGRKLVTGREVTLAATSAPKSWTKVAEARDEVADITGVRNVTLASGDDVDLSTSHVSVDAAEKPARLDGLVGDQATADAITAAAKKQFGEVAGSIGVVPGVTAGASVGLSKSLSALGDISDPKVVVNGDNVTVSGTAANQGVVDAAGKALKSALPTSATANLDTVAVGGSGALNQADSDVLAGAKVYFAPGSAVLDTAAATTLDQVSEILQAHPDVSVSLVGQAGPNNPKPGLLSLRRGEPAKAYLVSRGVDADQLTTGAKSGEPEAGFATNDSRYRRVDVEVKEK